MDFDNFCSFFECHSIFAEKQRTKQTNYSSLSLSASLDTQDTLQGGIIVEWKKFWQEIPVWSSSVTCSDDSNEKGMKNEHMMIKTRFAQKKLSLHTSI